MQEPSDAADDQNEETADITPDEDSTATDMELLVANISCEDPVYEFAATLGNTGGPFPSLPLFPVPADPAAKIPETSSIYGSTMGQSPGAPHSTGDAAVSCGALLHCVAPVQPAKLARVGGGWRLKVAGCLAARERTRWPRGPNLALRHLPLLHVLRATAHLPQSVDFVESSTGGALPRPMQMAWQRLHLEVQPVVGPPNARG